MISLTVDGRQVEVPAGTTVLEAASRLGINIPTGKDSLSMTQKYSDQVVYAPGTVIISAAGEVTDVRKIVEPVLRLHQHSALVYIDMARDDFKLGGSSFAQYKNRLGTAAPTVTDPGYFVKAFNLLQNLVEEGIILAGHDISAGGLVTTLLEMCFANSTGGLEVDISGIPGETGAILFSEKPGVVIQVDDPHIISALLEKEGILHHIIGRPIEGRELVLRSREENLRLDIDHYRDLWFRTSYLLDRKQADEKLAGERYKSYRNNTLDLDLGDFHGSFESLGVDPHRRSESGTRAAIIREKGVNGDREMAHALYLAGFDVKDVHMTDLITGRETLEDVQMIVFVGGFSNSDVLGSAKGWAGAFRYNAKARQALENFYARKDTLSLGVCNGCQLMIELDLVVPEHDQSPKMGINSSGKL